MFRFFLLTAVAEGVKLQSSNTSRAAIDGAETRSIDELTHYKLSLENCLKFHLSQVQQPDLTREKKLHHEKRANQTVAQLQAIKEVIQLREEELNKEECGICFEGAEDGAGEKDTTLPCGHQFHAACIDRWLASGHNTCPLCR